MKYIMKFNDPQARQLKFVGGKNASLASMIQDLADKVPIPDGFAITVDAYWHFLSANKLVDKIAHICQQSATDASRLQQYAADIRALILDGKCPDDLKAQIVDAYQVLSKEYQQQQLFVAVRSSATAEDLPTASFAGQQESYLCVQGDQAVLDAVKNCMASLFTERAMFYRMQHNIAHMKVGISVGVQKMVNVGNCAAGIAFSLDPQTGFKDALVIDGSYGFGELVVKGKVTPDEFVLFKQTFIKGFTSIIKKELGSKQTKLIYNKNMYTLQEVATTVQEQQSFCLSEADILQLATYVERIERYYSDKNGTWTPQDIEWAQDQIDGQIYIVQARPETIYSAQQSNVQLTTYTLQTKEVPQTLTKGLSVGQQIVAGKATVITSIAQAANIKEGDIIVTEMTDPDWVPSMKRAAAIITERGGRTCHAAIVSRELGIPALVGTGNATTAIAHGSDITLDCSQGDIGYVYQGFIPFEKKNIVFTQVKGLPTKILVNIASPHRAFALSTLPVQGVGLARVEFILTNQIGIHPMAILYPDRLDDDTRNLIAHKSAAYPSARDFFVQTLAQGIGMIAAAFWPREVDVRFSDLKSNEYRNLIGGTFFEPIEQNPMIGLRGASRYYQSEYQEAFQLECEAVLKDRSQMGFDNIRVMFPFVRTVDEAQKITTLASTYGLQRGKDGLKTIMVLEIPANALLIDQFTLFFDGFSIGSNDLTQLALGVDRDSERLATLFDEQDPAVKKLIEQSIAGAHAAGCFISICGQAPSDYPEFAQWLISLGIDAISLNVDAVIPFLMQQHNIK